MHISEMEYKIQKESSVFWYNSVWSCCRKFCILRQEYLSSAVNVLTNSLKIFNQSKAVFFQSIYPKLMGKGDSSGALLLSAVFGTRKHVDYRMVFWSKTF